MDALKFGCLTIFFSFSPKVVAPATRANHGTTASMKIFLLLAQKHALDSANLVAF